MTTSATAIFYAPRANFLDAIKEALADQSSVACGLFCDGKRLAWLPAPRPGWFRISYANLKEAA